MAYFLCEWCCQPSECSHLGPLLEFEAGVSSGQSLSIKPYRFASYGWVIYKEIVKKALINWAVCGECTDNRWILKSVSGPVSSLLFWKQIFWVVSHLRVLQVWAPFHPLVYFLFPLYPITESCNCSELLSLFALKGFEFCNCLMRLLPSWLKFLEVFTSLRTVAAVVLWVFKGWYLCMVLWLSILEKCFLCE